MKSKRWIFIIGIPVAALALAFALRLFIVERDGYGGIGIWYLIDINENGYRQLALKHSLAKFSKVEKGMEPDEIYKLVGKQTNTTGSGYIWCRYKLGGGWSINLEFCRARTIEIVDYTNNRRFLFEDLEYEYGVPPSYLSAAAQSGGNSPKHSLAKFSKIEIGMSPAEAFKLAGKPTDSAGTGIIWHRYKLDDGWYINLHFFNEKLIEMCIVDYPNNREFALRQDDYSSIALAYRSAVDQNSSAGTFTDSRDGKTYRTVKIGEQTWMAENLNFETGNSACYNNADSNCTKYGRLYDWETAMKACPAPWRVPSSEEWAALALAAAGRRGNGNIHWNIAGAKLKSTTGWNNWKDDGGNWRSGNGTDDFGFSALPAGIRFSSESFFSVGLHSNWWSSTEIGAEFAVDWDLFYFSTALCRDGKVKTYQISLRCVEDAAGLR